MSRSRRKTPILGHTTAKSEKWFKKAEHKRERRIVRMKLLAGAEIMPHRHQFANPWMAPKDGKSWWSPEQFRKEWNEEEGRHVVPERIIKHYTQEMRK